VTSEFGSGSPWCIWGKKGVRGENLAIRSGASVKQRLYLIMIVRSRVERIGLCRGKRRWVDLALREGILASERRTFGYYLLFVTVISILMAVLKSPVCYNPDAWVGTAIGHQA
jgi:hypothetical protein